jgi:hypothetical protein
MTLGICSASSRSRNGKTDDAVAHCEKVVRHAPAVARYVFRPPGIA